MTKYKETSLFVLLNYIELKAHLYSVVYTSMNISMQFITIPQSKDLFYRVHCHAFNSFILTLLCENRKRSLILSDAVAEITEL